MERFEVLAVKENMFLVFDTYTNKILATTDNFIVANTIKGTYTRLFCDTRQMGLNPYEYKKIKFKKRNDLNDCKGIRRSINRVCKQAG